MCRRFLGYRYLVLLLLFRRPPPKEFSARVSQPCPPKQSQQFTNLDAKKEILSQKRTAVCGNYPSPTNTQHVRLVYKPTCPQVATK